jgi:hypothetical protein
MARDEGVLVSISSDAHSVLQFNNLKHGIGQAWRGWLTKDDVLNTRPLSELKRLFGQRPVVIFGTARMAAQWFVAATAAAATLICSPVPAATAEKKPMSLIITSTAFSPNGAIPALYSTSLVLGQGRWLRSCTKWPRPSSCLSSW